MARGVRNGQAFHASDETYVEYTIRLLDRAVESGRITAEDAGLIRRYLAEVTAETGISGVRRYKIAIQIVGLRRFLPPFRQATAADLFDAVERIRTARTPEGAPMFKRNTQADMIRFLRRFYLWLIEEGYNTIDGEKIRKKIKPPAYERMTRTAEELLTEEEVRALIDASRTPKDKALIATLYETGCRIGEIAALTWKDITFTDWSAAINTAGKTGKPRYIPIVVARGYLAAWKAAYPGKPAPDARVFVTSTTHTPLQYAGVVKQLRKIAARAGVEKHITPHLFRHSRITHLLRQGVSEAVIKKMMWGSLATDMLKTYGHLVGADIDQAIAQLNGIAVPGAKGPSEAMQPRQCPRCHMVWGPDLEHCGKCGLALTEEAARTERLVMAAVDAMHCNLTPADHRAIAIELDRIRREEAVKGIS